MNLFLEIGAIESAIINTDRLPKAEQAKRIAEIWDALDQLETLAEARMRLAIWHTEKPKLADPPQ